MCGVAVAIPMAERAGRSAIAAAGWALGAVAAGVAIAAIGLALGIDFMGWAAVAGLGAAAMIWRDHRRARQWRPVADALSATLLSPPERDLLQRFGDPPWRSWPDCQRFSSPQAIVGSEKEGDYWVLDVAFLSRTRGDDLGPRDATVAVMRLSSDLDSAIKPPDDFDDLVVTRRGAYLFAWRPARRGGGRELPAGEIPRLLIALRHVAATLSSKAVSAPPLATSTP